MVDVTVLPGFVAMILLFLAPPGPDMAYMFAVGLGGGRRAAVKAILGIGTGMSVYGIAVAVGLGEVTRTHPSVLDAVRIVGAAYLLWLTYVTVRGARRAISEHGDVTAGRWYVRGLVVALANPKIMLFFLAVLPQFIGGARNTGAQLAMLGAINVATEVVLYGCIGVLVGGFHARLLGNRTVTAVLNYVASAVYFVLATIILVEVSTT